MNYSGASPFWVRCWTKPKKSEIARRIHSFRAILNMTRTLIRIMIQGLGTELHNFPPTNTNISTIFKLKSYYFFLMILLISISEVTNHFSLRLKKPLSTFPSYSKYDELHTVVSICSIDCSEVSGEASVSHLPPLAPHRSAPWRCPTTLWVLAAWSIPLWSSVLIES